MPTEYRSHVVAGSSHSRSPRCSSPRCPVYGQNGAVGIAFPATGITVDGDLCDWPKNLETYPIERIEFGDKLANDNDLKAHFRLAYNPGERALYVAVEVRDDSIVLDGPGEPVWNAQDGCELFIDAAHSPTGSPIIQYARYGNQNRALGPIEGADKKMKVAVTRTDSRTVYEWRIETDAELEPDRVIGFDVSVADKDKDGSFSWAAWGPGTQKLDVAGRCGEFLLVTPETRFGEVSGRVAWKDPSLACPTRPGADPVVANSSVMARCDTSIRRGPTSPRRSPRVPTRSVPWTRLTFAST